jgi:hypothetical protein
MTPTDLRRVQWAVRGTLTLGVAASVTANILHARPNPIAQAIAAWPPLAMLITVELVSHIPIYRRSLSVVRILATTGIAGIAAWVSYQHMAGVAARYGETGSSPYLLPLSVDGLIVVASVSLVELAGRLRDTPSGSVGASSAESHAQPPPGNTENPAAYVEPASSRQEHLSTTISLAREESEPIEGDDDLDGVNLAPDLGPLLPAARAARDELISEGCTVSRDALAARLRRNGHAVRNNRVSELLKALKPETRPMNGARPTASV